MPPVPDRTAASGLRPEALPLWQAAPLHGPCVLWFTGLSGAGKSTIADRLQQRLDGLGCHTARLDGDDVREGLCDDLGFSAADRRENIRRVAHVARLMTRSRLIVLVTLVSPFAEARAEARALFPEGEFMEVFVDAPLAVVRGRDTKGLYARADGGEHLGLTGVQAPYEPPSRPEVHLWSDHGTPDDACDVLLRQLLLRGCVHAHALRRAA